MTTRGPTEQTDPTRQFAARMLACECGIAAVLDRYHPAVQAHREAAAAVEQFRRLAAEQRAALAAYLGDSLDPPGTMPLSAVPGEDDSGTGAVSGALRQLAGLFHDAAVGYEMLHAMAMRRFVPPLRELAPRHLRGYAEAVHAIHRLLPAVVAWEMAQHGLYCTCVCPMCSAGACGCVALTTEAVEAAWRETAPAADTAPGFPLQAPRPGSQLAVAGLQGGDRLLTVGGVPVGSFREVQAELRAHQSGESIRLRVQRGGGLDDIVVMRADA